jgi:toxin YhaV
MLLFHDQVLERLSRLHSAALRAERHDPAGFDDRAAALLFGELSQILLKSVPADPSRSDYRQGGALGTTHRHWRQANVGRRPGVFFRFDSRSRVIVYGWICDIGGPEA